MDATVRVAVLGPLEVHVDGVALTVGARGRALLAALALDPGAQIPAERLVQLVWPEGAPGAGRNTLQALVSRTRRSLGPAAGALQTGDRGYALRIPDDAVDASVLEAAVLAARTDDSGVGAAELATALAAWRGEPFPEIADAPEVVAVASRLHELRLEAVELHAEAVLASGDGDGGLVADLRAVADEHPSRERLHRVLAVALYRSGRQVDALGVIDALAERLRDDLGLDPDPRTVQLRTALLRHELPVPTTGPVAQARPASGGVGRPRPLPRPRTSFVGRAAERAELRSLLAGSRVVTLIGPGGAGKTRLAVDVAERAVEPDGSDAAFIDLAPLTDPSDVLAEVASAVGLAATSPAAPGAGPAALAAGERPLADRLRDHVRHLRLLVVLDNCEHVVQAAADAVELLLDAGPDVRVLATSREGLRVDGEHLYPVPPMHLPDAAAAPDLSDAARSEAVELFVQRARAADPTFEADEVALPAVVELCRRLDGLPLGIELAAARVGSLPVTVLAQRLGQRFSLLTGGRRAGRRQETLEAVVAWSYDLLDDRQQRVFRRLGVVNGEVSIELAERILAAPDLPAEEVLPAITDLASRSLVSITTRPGSGDGVPAAPSGRADAGARGTPAVTDGGARVRMLETIRAYAHTRLVADDDVAAARTRHAAVLADRAATAARAIRGGPDQLLWFQRLDAEIDEHRAGAAWSLETDPLQALRTSTSLAWYGWLRDRHEEAARWLQRSLDAAGPDVPPEDAAIAWAWLGFLLSFSHRQTDAERAVAAADAALRRAIDPPAFVAAGVPLLVAYVRAFGDAGPAGVLADLGAAVDLAEQAGEAWLVGAGRFVLAMLASAAGDRPGGREQLDLGLAAAAESGDRWVEFQLRQQYAMELTIDGEYTAAADHLDRAIPLGEAIGAYGHARTTRVHRAVTDLHRGELDAAHRELARLAAAGGGSAGAYAASMLALTARRRGDAHEAVQVASDAAERYFEVDEPAGAVVALVQLTLACLEAGDVSRARAVLDRAVTDTLLRVPVVVLGTAVPYLLETDAAVIVAEAHHASEGAATGDPSGDTVRAAAREAARRLGRAAWLREQLGRPLVAAECTDVDAVEAAIEAAIGAEDAAAAVQEGREHTGMLPPLD